MRSMNVSLSDNLVYLRTSKVSLARGWPCRPIGAVPWWAASAGSGDARRGYSVLVGAGPQPLLCLDCYLPPPSLSSHLTSCIYTRVILWKFRGDIMKILMSRLQGNLPWYNTTLPTLGPSNLQWLLPCYRRNSLYYHERLYWRPGDRAISGLLIYIS